MHAAARDEYGNDGRVECINIKGLVSGPRTQSNPPDLGLLSYWLL